MADKFFFGSGDLFAVRTDKANATPEKLGALQGVSIDFASSIKELFGTKQMPIAVGRGTMKISGKAQYAALTPKGLGELFFGVDAVSGSSLVVNQTATIPATPFQITPAGTFAEDLGVVFSLTGEPLVRVASAPATGQYSETAGVYTFASADAADEVVISHRTTVTTGSSVTLTSQKIGVNPTFKIVLSGSFDGEDVTLELYKCVATKWSFGSKVEDFNISDFEFSAFVNSAGQLGKVSASA